MTPSPLATLIHIHKALAHAARLRILAMLREGELCVCQITAVLQLAASTVSAHLAELKAAGLVEERKNGRWVHYRLSASGTSTVAGIWPVLSEDAATVEDRRLLATLRSIAVEEVCRPDFDLRQHAASVECCP